MSEYEKFREAKIARNNAHLEKLGLLNAASSMHEEVESAKKAKATKRKKAKSVPAAPTRRSSRAAKPRRILDVEAWGDHDEYDPQDADYDSEEDGSADDDDDEDEDVDDDDDDDASLDEEGNKKKKKTRKRKARGGSARVSLSPPKPPKPSDLERITEEMNGYRAALDEVVKSVVKSEPMENASEEESQKLATSLWGSSCCPPPSCSWSTFLNSRLSTPSPNLPTPYVMMQERYAHDGWKLLCACVLMSRCSSKDTKERCIGGFFEMCPKPSDFANLDPEKLRKIVHSLGFQVDRVKSLSAVTSAWLTRGSFGLDLVPEEKGGMKIWGAGAFTVDSYYLFAKGDRDWKMLCSIDDVVWFRGWLRKQEYD